MSAIIPASETTPRQDDIDEKSGDVKATAVDEQHDKIRKAREDFGRQAAMSVREGLRTYRWAVIWSALMTLTVVMESYDYGLMGSLYGFPDFAEKFGDRLANGKYNVR